MLRVDRRLSSDKVKENPVSSASWVLLPEDLPDFWETREMVHRARLFS
jgi:hypothetical protein